MNSKNVKGRGKRFIASFLAVLMVVTMLPVNAVSVAYAEEPDVIETELTDSVVVAGGETEAVEDNAVIEEETPQVNEEASEETEPEDDLIPDAEENPAVEEVTAEVAEDVISADAPSYAIYDATDEYTAIKGTLVFQEATKIVDKNTGAAVSSLTAETEYKFSDSLDSIFSLIAHTSAKIASTTNGPLSFANSDNTKTEELSYYLQTGGSTNNNHRASIKFTTTGEAKVTVLYTNTSNDTRKVKIMSESNQQVAIASDGSTSADGVKWETLTVPSSGNYYICGDINAIRIYKVVVAEKPSVTAKSLAAATAKLSMTGATWTDEASTWKAAYTGNKITPDVTVTLSDSTEVTGAVIASDFDITYARKTGDSDPVAADYKAADDEDLDLKSVGTVFVKVAAKASSSDYINAATPIAPVSFEITKGAAPTVAAQTYAMDVSKATAAEKSASSMPQSIDLNDVFAEVLPEDAGNVTYSNPVCTNADSGQNVLATTPALEIAADGTTLTLNSVAEVPSTTVTPATVTVSAASDNYADMTLTVNLTVKSKTAVTISGIKFGEGNNNTVTYTGSAVVPNIDGLKVAYTESETEHVVTTSLTKPLVYTYATKAAEGQTSVELDTAPTNVGEYTVTVSVSPNETDYSGETTIDFTIEKATLTVTAKNRAWGLGYPSIVTTEADTYGAWYTVTGLVADETVDSNWGLSVTYDYKTGGNAITDWSTITENATIAIVPAVTTTTAPANYTIATANGTLSVIKDEVIADPDNTHILNLTKDWQVVEVTEGQTTKKVLKTIAETPATTDGYFTVSGDPKTAASGNSYPLVEYNQYKNALKGDSNAAVTFTAKKNSTVEIIAHIRNGSGIKVYDTNTTDSNKPAIAGMQTAELKDADNNAIQGVIVPPPSTVSASDHAKIYKVTATIPENGSYTIARGVNSGEFQLYYVKVIEPGTQIQTYAIALDKTGITDAMATVTPVASPKNTATAGTVINLMNDVATVSAASGYEFVGWEVKETVSGTDVTVGGNATDGYTFTMPAAAVTVKPLIQQEGTVTEPTATPGTKGGSYAIGEGEKVVLAALGTPDHIYYTTGTDAEHTADPTTDTANRTDYATVSATGGIAITGAMTIKAVAEKGGTYSNVVTYSYTIATDPNPGVTTLTGVTLSGNARVGETLTATPAFNPTGTPDATKTSTTYAWYRVPATGAATPITGATSSTYAVTSDDVGSKIKVVVSFTNEESTTVTKEAESATVTASNIKKEGLEIEFDDGTEYIYTGAAIKPSITVYNNGTALVEGTDYTVKYTNNTNASEKLNDAGTAWESAVADKKKPTVTVTGKGSLSKKITANFKIYPKALEDKDDVSSAANTVPSVKADGVVVAENKKAAPVLLYGGAKLAVKKNFEYVTPEEKDKKDWAEGAEINLKGVGNFTGTTKLTVHVATAQEQKDAKIKADFRVGDVVGKDAVKNLTYTGAEIKIGFEVSTKTKQASDLTEGTDYVISYPADLVNVGTKKVTITGISKDCVGTVTKSYSVKAALKTGTFDVTGVDSNGYDYVSTGVTFTGDNAITVAYKESTEDDAATISGLVEGRDYKISYSNNKKVSTEAKPAKYTITGLGNYKGVALKNQAFKINPVKLTGNNTDVNVTVADMLYGKAGVYKSVPYVTVDGVLLKASEYVAYYTVVGENETESKGKPRKILDAEFTESVTSLTVTVRIEPKSANVTGPAENTAETALTATYKVIKDDTKTKANDLSKAKITFYGGDVKNKVGYTGKAVYPTKMEIKPSGGTAVEVALGSDGQPTDTTLGLTLTYADNVAKGKATAVLTAGSTSTYVGGKAGTFNIVAKDLSAITAESSEGFIDFKSLIKAVFGK